MRMKSLKTKSGCQISENDVKITVKQVTDLINHTTIDMYSATTLRYITGGCQDNQDGAIRIHDYDDYFVTKIEVENYTLNLYIEDMVKPSLVSRVIDYLRGHNSMDSKLQGDHKPTLNSITSRIDASIYIYIVSNNTGNQVCGGAWHAEPVATKAIREHGECPVDTIVVQNYRLVIFIDE